MQNSKNVLRYVINNGAINQLPALLAERRCHGSVTFCIDHYFKASGGLGNLPLEAGDEIYWVDTGQEPTTEYLDALASQARKKPLPGTLVAIGGGSSLDTGKALANLLTNPGKSEEYQGWDLLCNPAIYKIGIPTLSGTGAEASRTCVLNNKAKNLKLGMNSDFTLFDQLVLDPTLTATVPRNQYFYTGMDTYIHCLESLNGSHRHAMADSFSRQAIALCREVFHSNDMQSLESREKLMVASYLGGCAIANSFVGLVHPLSAALSMVLGTRHCLANCLVMQTMEDFYPSETEEYLGFLAKQNINLPTAVCSKLNESDLRTCYQATIIHEKPLTNALGTKFRDVLTFNRFCEIFLRI